MYALLQFWSLILWIGRVVSTHHRSHLLVHFLSLLAEFKENIRRYTLGPHTERKLECLQPQELKIHTQSLILMSMTHLLFLLFLCLAMGELAWHWGCKIWWSTSFTVEIHSWQETGTTFCCFLQPFGSFCKKIKSLEIMEKILISCPILFSFFFFLRITEGCVGRIYSYLEWIEGNERHLP